MNIREQLVELVNLSKKNKYVPISDQMDLIEQMPETHCIIIDENRILHYSKGLKVNEEN